MKIWWHVVTSDMKVYGFASIGNIVVDAPFQSPLKNKTLEDIKQYFFKGDIVSKIGEINLDDLYSY